jgi:hypothetical protein
MFGGTNSRIGEWRIDPIVFTKAVTARRPSPSATTACRRWKEMVDGFVVG